MYARVATHLQSRLDAHALRHKWTRTAALNYLLEEALKRAEHQDRIELPKTTQVKGGKAGANPGH